MQAADMVVRGRVQGVGYRFFVRQTAKDQGITGWVKNLPDRTVAVHAEGERAALEVFIDTLREGTSFARITDIDIDWLEPSGQFADFEIRF